MSLINLMTHLQWAQDQQWDWIKNLTCISVQGLRRFLTQFTGGLRSNRHTVSLSVSNGNWLSYNTWWVCNFMWCVCHYSSMSCLLQAPQLMPKWEEAIQTELDQLAWMHTWRLMKKPSNAVPISNKWVLTKKYNKAGELVKYKARLIL